MVGENEEEYAAGTELKVDGAAQKGLQLWRESALGAAVECYLIFTSAADPRAKCHHTEGR
jgi:hypothetical protein